ncbi:hypothetical protein VTK56DRAFT_7051 [Thermocarpiscus australiensis]
MTLEKQSNVAPLDKLVDGAVGPKGRRGQLRHGGAARERCIIPARYYLVSSGFKDQKDRAFPPPNHASPAFKARFPRQHRHVGSFRRCQSPDVSAGRFCAGEAVTLSILPGCYYIHILIPA